MRTTRNPRGNHWYRSTPAIQLLYHTFCTSSLLIYFYLWNKFFNSWTLLEYLYEIVLYSSRVWYLKRVRRSIVNKSSHVQDTSTGLPLRLKGGCSEQCPARPPGYRSPINLPDNPSLADVLAAVPRPLLAFHRQPHTTAGLVTALLLYSRVSIIRINVNRIIPRWAWTLSD